MHANAYGCQALPGGYRETPTPAEKAVQPSAMMLIRRTRLEHKNRIKLFIINGLRKMNGCGNGLPPAVERRVGGKEGPALGLSNTNGIPCYDWGVAGGITGTPVPGVPVQVLGFFWVLPGCRVTGPGKPVFPGGLAPSRCSGGGEKYESRWNGEIRCHTDFGLFVFVLYLSSPWRRLLTDRA